MSEPIPGQNDAAENGTVYWTLSLYIAPEALTALNPAYQPERARDIMGEVQQAHAPSVVLRNAVDPLFNDIADREFFGSSRDFLLAAGLGHRDPANGEPWEQATATRAILDQMRIDMAVPADFSWTTEGVRFDCHLGPQPNRQLDLRRFWFAHSNGALTYHLSFAHRFACTDDDYTPETYYFLSLLQKLAAPKEFALHGSTGVSPLPTALGETPQDLGIAAFDRIMIWQRNVTDPAPPTDAKRFWHFVHDLFVADAGILLGELLGWTVKPDRLTALLKPVSVLEVPGLLMPRCRYLFHFDDQRFFDRLLPQDRDTGASLPRKAMVRDQCFAPYRQKVARLMKPDGKTPVPVVHLGKPPGTVDNNRFLDWSELDLTGDYEWALAKGYFTQADGTPIADITTFAGLVRRKDAVRQQMNDPDPGSGSDEPIPCVPFDLYVPAFTPGRRDCIDYLFLSGFNQNIIDWLNQDTSEILDSIDPIYPAENEQSEERFFVRYANHRGMITYVAGSRSLEIGNDYIGTCPYAFLIHVLAMHNEFLARDHESRSIEAIERIDAAVIALDARCEPGDPLADCMAATNDDFFAEARSIERQINALKRASYMDYERHRYINVFRYDTEADVFASLARLRGTDRRSAAMDKALATLEEYADDIERRQVSIARQREEDARRREEEHIKLATQREKLLHQESEDRSKRIGALIGVVGVISAVSILFTVGDFISKHPHGLALAANESWAGFAFGLAGAALALMGVLALIYLAIIHRTAVVSEFKRYFWAYRTDTDGDNGASDDALD